MGDAIEVVKKALRRLDPADDSTLAVVDLDAAGVAVVEALEAAGALMPDEAASLLQQRAELHHQVEEARAELTELDDPDLGAECPYYARHHDLPGHDPEAVCSMGCRDEPACVTCEPLGGWPSSTRRALTALLQEVREVLGPLLKTPFGAWVDYYRGPEAVGPVAHSLAGDRVNAYDQTRERAITLLQKIDQAAPRSAPASSSDGAGAGGEVIGVCPKCGVLLPRDEIEFHTGGCGGGW